MSIYANSVRDLYRLNAEHAGATITPSDSEYNVITKWVIAEGGTPRPDDTKNNLLAKLANARGVSAFPGDSDNNILHRIAGVGPNFSEPQTLVQILHSGGAMPPGSFIQSDPVGSVFDLSNFRFTLGWSTSTGAASYRVVVASDAGFTTIVEDTNVGNVNTYPILISYGPTTLYSRIYAVNSAGETVSNDKALTYPPATTPTPAPVLTADAPNETVQWALAAPSGFIHIILETSPDQVSWDPGLPLPIADEDSAVGPDVYVRARFVDPGGFWYSAYSNIVHTYPTPTPAPVIADDGGGVVSWLQGPGNVPTGFTGIEFLIANLPDFSDGVTDQYPVGEPPVYLGEEKYVKARFNNGPGPGPTVTDYGNTILTSA